MITFVGHVSKDVNIIGDKKSILPGGGVFYGSFTARSLGEDTRVVTKVSETDRILFEEMVEYGIDVVFLNSENTTSIENVYPSENPDERISRMVSRSDPFGREDLRFINGDVVHITPLWYGEFPEELIPDIREKAEILSGDAQGFLRNVESDGRMVYRDWERKGEFLGYFDVFKLDINEAEIMLKTDDPKEALRKMMDYGIKEVVLTRSDGVFIVKNGEFAFSSFGEWTLEGRTGRGDTCIAAYLVMRNRFDSVQKIAETIALITTKKMQHTGPYRGW